MAETVDITFLGKSGTQSLAEEIKALKENVANIEDSALDEYLAMYFNMQKTGKIYQTKLYKFASNPTSTGEKLLDNEGLVFEPSTDTEEGEDDYADIPLFQWWHCNYVRNDSGDPYVTAIKGSEEYAEEGLVDVGAMGMTFYWNVDTSNEDYDLWTISDSPNDELGLVPWCESVRADGTVAPYWCHSAFMSTVDTEDGLPRSLPGKKMATGVSYSSMITDYQKKGAGYWGAGVCRSTFQMIFNVIMGATKNSQLLYAGMTRWYFQYTAAVEREENDTYFPVTADQTSELIVGAYVSVGYESSDESTDRINTNMCAYAECVKILSIEELGDEDGNYAVYLDVDEGFPTAQVEVAEGVTSEIYMSAWFPKTGETNSVIGKHNGSPGSNTSRRFPYRVQGTEYINSNLITASDAAAVYESDGSVSIYMAQKGTPRSTEKSEIESTYKLAGTIIREEASTISIAVGDIGVDKETGVWWVTEGGASTSTGWGDYAYFTTGIWSGAKAYKQGHVFSPNNLVAGSAATTCTHGFDEVNWHSCSCD